MTVSLAPRITTKRSADELEALAEQGNPRARQPHRPRGIPRRGRRVGRAQLRDGCRGRRLLDGRRRAPAPRRRAAARASTCCSSTPATTSPRRASRATRSGACSTCGSSTCSPSRPSPSRTPSSARSCYDRDPGAVLRAPQGRSAEGRARAATRCGSPASAARRRRPARTRRSCTWDERNGLVKVNPVAAWTLRRPARLRRRPPGAGEPPRVERLPLDRLRAVHEAGRRRRRPPIRPLGRPLEDGMRAPRHDRPTPLAPAGLSTLDLLEAEAIHIIREVVAEFERPVLLFSGGKDSVVVLHLATKAFAPGRVPFPVLHVDTGHNFPEVLAFRDETVARLGRAARGRPRAGLHRRRTPAGARPTARATRCRPCRCSTRSPRAATTPCSAAPAATKTRRAPRSASSRCATSSGSGIRATSAPSCGACTTAATPRASTCARSRSRTGPSSTSGATSSARAIPLPPLYFAHEREVYAARRHVAPGRRVLAAARRRAASRRGPSAIARSAT